MRLLVLAALATLAACFSPTFNDTTCGVNDTCPPGFRCIDGVCRRDGMPTDAAVDAIDAPGTATVTVTRSGAGTGTVTSDPTGVTCGATCSATFPTGTQITLTAAPGASSSFTGWTGGGCTGTSTTCTFTLTGNVSVAAAFEIANHTVTVVRGGNGAGTVVSTPSGINCGTICSIAVADGASLTLNATPDASSVFLGWSGGGCSGTGACTLSVTGDVTVNASFGLNFSVVVTRTGNGSGTVTSSPAGINCGADCDQVYTAGTMVTLTAAPSASSTFNGWTGGGCSGTGPCTVTVNAAIAVNADFTLRRYTLTAATAGTGGGVITSTPGGITCGADCTELYDHGTAVTLTATPNGTSLFTGWSGACTGTGSCIVTMDMARSVTATFAQQTAGLNVARNGTGSGTVTSSPAGINCGADCNETFVVGTVVTLTATAAPGSMFTGWSGGGCSGTGTCMITVSAADTVTATFTLNQYTLTVSRNGTGSGTVTSTPAGINCGTDCSESLLHGSMMTLTATAATGSTLTGWTGGGCTGTGTCSVTMTAITTVTATFTLDPHTLDVTRSGSGSGTVTSSPTGINCGTDCTESYVANTMVTLTATPAAGSRFVAWTGACTGSAGCVVTMDAARSVNAEFRAVFVLTVTTSGSGSGTVSSSPAGINCGADCNETYDTGASVTLTPTPAAGSRFVAWTGACTGAGGCNVTMSAARTVNAEFRTIHTLTVTRTGTGQGTVTSTPTGIDCGIDCTQSYDVGTTVTLTATPAAGSTFMGWTGGGCTGTGTCMVTMIAATTVTATFTINQYTLTVMRAGTGSGTVTSSPAGINCGTDCNELYTHGTMITLTGTPAVGSVLTGWSGGGCTGTGTCVVTLTAATTVTATFGPAPHLLTVNKAGNGFGTVTAVPAGIDCGADCTEPYVPGTVVTLTAVATSTPLSEDSSFAGWTGGGCSGTGTCVVTMNAATTVTATFSLDPNYAFITSQFRNGNMGGIAGADGVCQSLANTAGLPGTFRAWLSSSTSSAASRIGAASGWIRPDGKVFARSQAELYVGHLIYPLRITETGAQSGVLSTFSATMMDGTTTTFASTCVDWTSSSTSLTTWGGHSSANAFWWTFWFEFTCSTLNRLSCLGVDRVAPIPPLPPVTGRRAFLTVGSFTGTTGLATADALCASEASAAGLAGTYKALLASPGTSAASRFNSTLPLVRVDNAIVLASVNMLSSASQWDAAIHVTANGTYEINAESTWTGATGPGVQGTIAGTCNNWTATTSTGNYGLGGESNVNQAFNQGTLSCDLAARLYCVQQL